MPLRDVALIAAVCVVWAMNNIVSKLVISDMGVPPLFFAALRFLVVVALVWPWLPPMPRPRLRLVAGALMMGAISFSFLFLGLRTASPSAAAVIAQLSVPITVVLSVALLGERVDLRRGLGIAAALAGALLVLWNPAAFRATGGLLLVVASATAGSLGVVLLKKIDSVKPLQFQAWVGVCSLPLVALLSLAVEENQVETAVAGGWGFVGALLFSALLSSIFAHTTYYGLIRRYEANRLAPLAVVTPILTVLLGVMITDDTLTVQMLVGSAIALAGVLVIVRETPRAAPSRAVILERPD